MLKVSLFDFDGPLEKIFLQQNALATDLRLATILLDVKFNGHEISRLGPPQIEVISSHSSIAIWEEKLIHAELLKTKYHPLLPSEMKIAYSWAYLWRVKPKKNLSFLTFECFLDPKQPIIDMDIETGEGLFSKSFSFGHEFIHIGTEDEDFLFQRADANDGLPSRYVKERKINYDNQNLIVASGPGIKVHLPSLKAGELAQLQFVVAGGEDPIANWFAVDPHPQDILLQAGCIVKF